METFDYEKVSEKFLDYDEITIIQCILETSSQLNITPQDVILGVTKIIKDVPAADYSYLPYEKIFEIALLLSDKDLLSLCLTSRSFMRVCDDDALWKTKTKERYGIDKLSKQNKTWREEYKTLSSYNIIVTVDHDWFAESAEFRLNKRKGDYKFFIEGKEITDFPIKRKLSRAFELTGLGPDMMTVKNGTVRDVYDIIYSMKIPSNVLFWSFRGNDRYRTYGDLFRSLGYAIYSKELGRRYFEYPDSVLLYITRVKDSSIIDNYNPKNIYLEAEYSR